MAVPHSNKIQNGEREGRYFDKLNGIRRRKNIHVDVHPLCEFIQMCAPDK